MENTPTVCADDLPTILNFLKVTQNRDVSTFFSVAGFVAPNSIKDFIYQPKRRPAKEMYGTRRNSQQTYMN